MWCGVVWWYGMVSAELSKARACGTSSNHLPPVSRIPTIQLQPAASSHPVIEPPGLQESMTPIMDSYYRGRISAPQAATARHGPPQAARHSGPAGPGILLKSMKINENQRSGTSGNFPAASGNLLEASGSRLAASSSFLAASLGLLAASGSIFSVWQPPGSIWQPAGRIKQPLDSICQPPGSICSIWLIHGTV